MVLTGRRIKYESHWSMLRGLNSGSTLLEVVRRVRAAYTHFTCIYMDVYLYISSKAEGALWDNGALKQRRGFLDRKLQGSRGDWQKNGSANAFCASSREPDILVLLHTQRHQNTVYMDRKKLRQWGPKRFTSVNRGKNYKREIQFSINPRLRVPLLKGLFVIV